MNYKVEQTLYLPKDVFNVSPRCFIVSITGSGMKGAGILPDDYVVFDPELEPENDDIVLVRTGKRRQVVRFLKENSDVRFRSESAVFRTIQAENYEILGVMVSLIRNGRGKDIYKTAGINWIESEIEEVE